MAKIDRREFLKRTAAAGSYGLVGTLPLPPGSRIAIVVDPNDPAAMAAPVVWAASELQSAFTGLGCTVERMSKIVSAARYDLTIVIAGSGHEVTRSMLRGPTVPTVPESVVLLPSQVNGKPALLASGSDTRGILYGVLELADRVQCSSYPLQNLRMITPIVESPANRRRGITRAFVSDVEDKPWFNDREFWPAYLSMLAAQRFNRFSLAFGIGYDFTNHITDCYFHFAYPFLLAVPGYEVKAVGLPDEERDRNLAMLRYISEQTISRGLEFQLGLWTHAYQWVDSPRANYTISGLTPTTHAAYCRDALHLLLEQCPAISSVAFRVHGESGVAEESYTFWKTVFDGIVAAKRTIEINLHAKGLDDRMIDVALATGMPVSLSPKYWAEHMGLPYHQAAIRETEKPPRDRQSRGFFALSSGSRQFLRYGYGDLMTADRRYSVYSRMWPGTQRVLLWGDPVIASGFGRASQFAGQEGADLFEPLSFKGRRGSGQPGGRCGYADRSLNPKYDWQKFLYTYRVWGRHLYKPDASPEVWQRFLSAQFQSAASEVETALAQAGRILPLVTTAHGPSAANNTYWPEMYTNMPDVDAGQRPLYGDSPRPHTFGVASAFDPQLFASVQECALELLNDRSSGKVLPIHVATWLEEMAKVADKSLSAAKARIGKNADPAFRRVALDVAIQTGLGRFFAAKFRSGVLYSIFGESGDPQLLQEALRVYREARDSWSNLAQIAQQSYASDISYGPEAHLRGNWSDRLVAIDTDIAAMEKKASEPMAGRATYPAEQVRRATQDALGKLTPQRLQWTHTVPESFRAGAELPIELVVNGADAPVTIFYRHVDQAEDWVTQPMEQHDGRYRTVVPTSYTQSPFAIIYYFQVRMGRSASLLPGVDPNVRSRPYYFVARDR